MKAVRVSGIDDPRVAIYRDIGDHDRLRARGLFVVEGRFVVERLLGDRRFDIHSLLLNRPAWAALESTCASLDPGVPVFLCETPDFEQLTGFNIHRGCLALATRPPSTAIDDVVEGARTLVILEDVANADNICGIFRNAAAFGADGVVLSDRCGDPLYRKAIRTSMAATLRVPFAVARRVAWLDTLRAIRDSGIHIVALTLDAASLDLDAFAAQPRRHRIAVLLGAEGSGLTADAQAFADVCVKIPIRADVDSLNVAVACGIALHRLMPRASP